MQDLTSLTQPRESAYMKIVKSVIWTACLHFDVKRLIYYAMQTKHHNLTWKYFLLSALRFFPVYITDIKLVKDCDEGKLRRARHNIEHPHANYSFLLVLNWNLQSWELVFIRITMSRQISNPVIWSCTAIKTVRLSFLPVLRHRWLFAKRFL